MSVRKNLMFNILVTMSSVAVIAAIGFTLLHYIALLSVFVVEQRTVPILKIKEIEGSAQELWSNLSDHVYTEDKQEQGRLAIAANSWEKHLQEQKQHFRELLDTQQQETTHEHWLDSITDMLSHDNGKARGYLEAQLLRDWVGFERRWEVFLKQKQQIIQLSDEGQNAVAEQALKREGRRLYGSAIDILHKLVLDYTEDLEAQRQKTLSLRTNSILLVSALIALLTLVMVWRINVSSRNITLPLQLATDTAEQITQGNLSARANTEQAPRELLHLLEAMNAMAEMLQQTIQDIDQQMDALAQGHLQQRMQRSLVGDFIKIQSSTNKMGQRLQSLIQESSDVYEALTEGNMKVRINDNFPGEFAHIKSSVNHMAENLQGFIQTLIENLHNIAQGEEEIQGSFQGDFVAIQTALHQTAEQLANARARATAEDWLKTGQTELNECMRGQQDVTLLAEHVLNYLCPRVQALIGLFYLYNEDEACLELQASYAFVKRKGLQNRFKLGEGLIGQAARERKMIIAHDVPADYIRIESGAGYQQPYAIIALPLLHEERLVGVLELGSFQGFAAAPQELLQQSAPGIAIAIDALRAQLRTKHLLLRSEKQAEQLRDQQSRLQETNDQLLEQKHTLQDQAEELQIQQEELRQTNEVLEQRTQDLERQQRSVEEKNHALERAQATLEAKAEELATTSRYKSEFLANMSHELRTPLNSLLILAQLLEENKDGNLSQKQLDHARTIRSAGRDLLNLINDILDLSKVEAGRVEVQEESFSLQELVEHIEDKFRPVAEDRKLNLKISLKPGLPEALHTDGHRLKQIVNNLLSNALKFTEQGEVEAIIYRPGAEELHQAGTQLVENDSVAIAVRDTGIGIPNNKLALVFEAFQQADGSTSRRFGGTGLGLSISRQLAQLLGGKLLGRSDEGKGSCFTLYLPQQFNKEAAAQAAANSKPSNAVAEALAKISTPVPSSMLAPVRSSGFETALTDEQPGCEDDRGQILPDDRCLLIVEDDVIFAQTMRDLAHEHGYKCLIAHSGEAALQLLVHYQPDAIVLDVGLPQLDGLGLMGRLKANLSTRHIPVHFITASEQAKEAERLGAVGYLMKPASLEELTQVFERIDHFSNNSARAVVLVSSSPERQALLGELIADQQDTLHCESDLEAAWQWIQQQTTDCIVLDTATQEQGALKLLGRMAQHPQTGRIPVIIYADKELSTEDEAYIQEYSSELILKAVHSPERLLDETTLFLHSVTENLPSNKRDMLCHVHDPEAVFKNRTVLLADDDIRNIYALTNILEEHDMQVLTAKNGQQALELLEQHAERVDIVLMDVMMPEMDGYEAIHAIRAQRRFARLPIIALTAKAMKGDRAKCIDAGANDYMPKPVDNAQLLSLMRVWLYH